MKKLNKILFGFGTVAAVVAPVAAVVACNEDTEPTLDIAKAAASKSVLLEFAKAQKLVDDKDQPTSKENWETFIKKYESSATVATIGQSLEDKMVAEFNLDRNDQGIHNWTITKDQAKKIAKWVNEKTQLSPAQRTFMWFDLIGEEGFKTLLTLA